MSTRRKAREVVLKALYSYEILEREADEIFDELVSDNSLSADHLEFARRYYDLVVKNLELLDDEIIRLAENWKLERIAIIDKIILRMALCEIHYMPDIPEKVAVNEAIDMAKIFSTLESSAFVNGILDAAMTTERPEPEK